MNTFGSLALKSRRIANLRCVAAVGGVPAFPSIRAIRWLIAPRVAFSLAVAALKQQANVSVIAAPRPTGESVLAALVVVKASAFMARRNSRPPISVAVFGRGARPPLFALVGFRCARHREEAKLDGNTNQKEGRESQHPPGLQKCASTPLGRAIAGCSSAVHEGGFGAPSVVRDRVSSASGTLAHCLPGAPTQAWLSGQVIETRERAKPGVLRIDSAVRAAPVNRVSGSVEHAKRLSNVLNSKTERLELVLATNSLLRKKRLDLYSAHSIGAQGTITLLKRGGSNPNDQWLPAFSNRRIFEMLCRNPRIACVLCQSSSPSCVSGWAFDTDTLALPYSKQTKGLLAPTSPTPQQWVVGATHCG